MPLLRRTGSITRDYCTCPDTYLCLEAICSQYDSTFTRGQFSIPRYLEKDLFFGKSVIFRPVQLAQWSCLLHKSVCYGSCFPLYVDMQCKICSSLYATQNPSFMFFYKIRIDRTIELGHKTCKVYNNKFSYEEVFCEQKYNALILRNQYN